MKLNLLPHSKTLVASSLVVTFVAAVSNAQTKTIQGTRNDTAPPPPPPAAARKLTSPYVSADGSFRVAFPVQPRLQVVEQPTSFGSSKIYAFVASTGTATYSLTYIDFPTEMTDRFDINMRLDLMRENQKEMLAMTVAEESALEYGSHYGRSTVYESRELTHSDRTIFAGPRMFHLRVSTRGKLSTQSDKLANINRQLIAKFFDSFELTSVPKARLTPVKLPKDFGIVTTNESFASTFLGVKMAKPKDWHFLSDSETEYLQELGKEQLRGSRPALLERLTDTTVRSLVTMSEKKLDEGPSSVYIFVLAEWAPYPNFLPLNTVKSYEQLFVDKGEKVSLTPTVTTINGIDFGVIETTAVKSGMRRRTFIANIKGIAFEVCIMYSGAEKLENAMTAIRSISVADDQKDR